MALELPTNVPAHPQRDHPGGDLSNQNQREQRGSALGDPDARASPPCRKALVLLSLFDGMGTARYAIETLLRRHQMLPALVASWFVEVDPLLALAVDALWRRQAATAGTPPHRQAAGDVWDLLRWDARAPRGVLATVPAQGLLMIVSGSPCRQLTTACPTRGIVGLCGHDSYLFYADPAVAWVSQCLRPDISVHVVNENVAVMRRLGARRE